MAFLLASDSLGLFLERLQELFSTVWSVLGPVFEAIFEILNYIIAELVRVGGPAMVSFAGSTAAFISQNPFLVAQAILIIALVYFAAKWVINFFKPNLRIVFGDETNLARDFPAGTFRFGTVLVENTRQPKALKCNVELKMLDSTTPFSKTVFGRVFLHWAEKKYLEEGEVSSSIDIEKGRHRLEIVFRPPDKSEEGCFFAIPAVLTRVIDYNRLIRDKYWLPAGDYYALLVASCANGIGDRKIIVISSPGKWEDLLVREATWVEYAVRLGELFKKS